MSNLITHCPLCGYGPFPQPWPSAAALRQSFDLCPCCGCEYGYDDNEDHLAQWIEGGCQWFDPGMQPPDWSLDAQLPHRIRPWPPVES